MIFMKGTACDLIWGIYQCLAVFVLVFIVMLLLLCNDVRCCLWSLSCLESKGCHLILLSCHLLFCFFLPCPVAPSDLSFFCYWSIFLTVYFQNILQHFSLRDSLFCMALVEHLGDGSWQVVCAACCPMSQGFDGMLVDNFR